MSPIINKNLLLGKWDALGKEQITKSQYIGTRAVQLAAATLAYYSTGRADIIIGYILPLYGVQNYEIARSYEQLQYRSVGNEFLAQQKGGNLGIRVDLLLTGPQQYGILAVLRLLYLKGIGRNEKYTDPVEDLQTSAATNTFTTGRYINGGGGPVKNVVTGLLDKLDISQVKTQYGKKTWSKGTVGTTATSAYVDTITLKDKNAQEITIKDDFDLQKLEKDKDYELYDVGDEGWRNNIVHRTFPFICKDEIIFDCYLETIILRRDLQRGPNVLAVTLLFRQYTPPPIIDKSEIELYWRKRELKNVGKVSDIIPKVKVTTKPRFSDMTVKDLEKVDWIINAMWRGQKFIRDSMYGKYNYGRQVPLKGGFDFYGLTYKITLATTYAMSTISIGGF